MRCLNSASPRALRRRRRRNLVHCARSGDFAAERIRAAEKSFCFARALRDFRSAVSRPRDVIIARKRLSAALIKKYWTRSAQRLLGRAAEGANEGLSNCALQLIIQEAERTGDRALTCQSPVSALRRPRWRRRHSSKPSRVARNSANAAAAPERQRPAQRPHLPLPAPKYYSYSCLLAKVKSRSTKLLLFIKLTVLCIKLKRHTD